MKDRNIPLHPLFHRLLGVAFCLVASSGTAALAAPVERELHFVVTVDAVQDWKKNDPKHPGEQSSKASTHQRWEVRTRLVSDGELQVRDLLDPDLDSRMDAKTIFLARRARKEMADAGQPFQIPHTPAEKDALMQHMQEQIMGCNADPTCSHDMTMRYAALMAVIEHPEALEPDTVPGRFLYFLPAKACLEESRVTLDLTIQGTRFNKDVDEFIPFTEHRSADTVDAHDGLALCEHFTATLDPKDPKGMMRQETIFVPTPVGITEHTENGHTSHAQGSQPLVAAALDWVNDVLRYAPTRGTASAALPIPLSLNGNSTWLGLWTGTAKVTVVWSFEVVPPYSSGSAPKP